MSAVVVADRSAPAAMSAVVVADRSAPAAMSVRARLSLAAWLAAVCHLL
jgi:hypothetical protein